MIFLSSLIHCKSVDKNPENNQDQIPKITQNTISSRSFNSNKTLQLTVTKLVKVGDPAYQIQYKVYTHPEKKIIKEGSFRGSDIIWNDSISLKIIPYVGMVKKPSDNSMDNNSKNLNAQETIIQLKEN